MFICFETYCYTICGISKTSCCLSFTYSVSVKMLYTEKFIKIDVLYFPIQDFCIFSLLVRVKLRAETISIETI